MRPVLWRKEGRRDAMITNEGRWRTRETQKRSQKVFEICAKVSCSVKCWHLSSAKALVVAEPKVQRHISFNNPQLEKQVVHMVLRKVLKWSCFICVWVNLEFKWVTYIPQIVEQPSVRICPWHQRNCHFSVPRTLLQQQMHHNWKGQGMLQEACLHRIS